MKGTETQHPFASARWIYGRRIRRPEIHLRKWYWKKDAELEHSILLPVPDGFTDAELGGRKFI